MASQSGQVELVKWILSLGVPWNATDKAGLCAGDYALRGGHQEVVELLITAGCQAELILSAAQPPAAGPSADDGFLEQTLEIGDSQILDENGDAVMMKWEKPLMEAHAEALCVKDGDVLNVGFGMGLIDEAIQRRSPLTHTIIEAHPQIYSKMVESGWANKPGVKIIHARWQDVVDDLPAFDSVFFDTYGEHYRDLQGFHRYLPKLLKPDGVYSYFNGMAPDNEFFHLVYCEIAKSELKSMGMTVNFVQLPLNVNDDMIWKGVRNKYWWNNIYYLPVAQLELKKD